jgi:spore coat protein A
MVGATEVWQLDIDEEHPIHLHLVQFQVLGDPTHAWKDTVGGGVSIVVRWTPQNVPAGAVHPGQKLYPFNPTAVMGTIDAFGFPGGPGYVWHCHRLKHEDNEMMRPYVVVP